MNLFVFCIDSLLLGGMASSAEAVHIAACLSSKCSFEASLLKCNLQFPCEACSFEVVKFDALKSICIV